MSIIPGNVDPRTLIGTGKVGLLKSTGTYDINRYPWAYDCWKRQQQTHWMGEEVPLGADIKDWQSGRLAESEKNLLTQIFRFFTQSDVEVGDNYLKRYIPIFQPLEVQMMMAAFTNMETVHIDAYALLLKTLGMPQAEFEAFRDYDEMKAKADYMHTFGVDTVADVARTLAMFGAFTEGMSLFAWARSFHGRCATKACIAKASSSFIIPGTTRPALSPSPSRTTSWTWPGPWWAWKSVSWTWRSAWARSRA